MDEPADEGNVPLYQHKAKGFLGKIWQKFFRRGKGTKREVLGSVSDIDNVPKSPEKKRRRRMSTVEQPGFDIASVSLSQNRFICVPSFTVLLTVDEEVINTFANLSQLKSFLEKKGVNAAACFQTELQTEDGFCPALVGRVAANDAIVNEPFHTHRVTRTNLALRQYDSLFSPRN